MKTVRERINDLPEDVAKNLAKALKRFNCDSIACSDCPLCQQDGVCLYILVDNRIYFDKW